MVDNFKTADWDGGKKINFFFLIFMYIPKDNKIIAVSHGPRYFPLNLSTESEGGDSNTFFPRWGFCFQ